MFFPTAKEGDMSMWDSNDRCDFPDCPKEVDLSNNSIPNAIINRKKRHVEVIGDDLYLLDYFCDKHAKILLAKGVKLKPCQILHAEIKEKKQADVRIKEEAARKRREQEYIDELKSLG